MYIKKKIISYRYIFVGFIILIILILFANNIRIKNEMDKIVFNEKIYLIKEIEKELYKELLLEIDEINIIFNHFTEFHPTNHDVLQRFRVLKHKKIFSVYMFNNNLFTKKLSDEDFYDLAYEYCLKNQNISKKNKIENVVIYKNKRILPFVFKSDIYNCIVAFFDLNEIFLSEIDLFIKNMNNPKVYILEENGNYLYKNDVEYFLDENIINKNILKENSGYKKKKNNSYVFWTYLNYNDSNKVKLVFEVDHLIIKNDKLKKYYLQNLILYIIMVILFGVIIRISFALRVKNIKINNFKNMEIEKENLELAIEGARDGLWIWDFEKDRMYYSNRWKEILGYDIDEFNETHYLLESNIIHPDYIEEVKIALKKHFSQKSKYYNIEYKIKCKDGNYKWIMDRGKAVFNEDNIPIKMVGYITDTHEWKTAEEQLKIYYKGIEYNYAMIVITNLDGNIVYANKKFEQVTGYEKDEILGKSLNILASGLNEKNVYDEMWETLKNKKDWQGEFINKKKNGDLYHEKNLISPILNDKKDIIYYIAIKEDITEIKKVHEKLEYYATKDTLTGSYNRRMGLEFLKFYINKCRHERNFFSIIYVDINDLKLVNDNFGHNAGDELINTVSQEIMESIRKTDMLSRLGGDEFLIILPECSETQAENSWKNIILKLSKKSLRSCDISIKVSHGTLEINQSNVHKSIEEIIEIADAIMYKEKIKLKKIKL